MSISFDEEFEAIGETKVRRMLLERDNANSVMLSYAPAWLSLKDSERIARLEALEAETLSVAKEANDVARTASRWAMWASIIAVIAIFSEMKDQISALIP